MVRLRSTEPSYRKIFYERLEKWGVICDRPISEVNTEVYNPQLYMSAT